MLNTLLIILGVVNVICGVFLGLMSLLAKKVLVNKNDPTENGLIKMFWSFSALFIANAVMFFIINGVGLCG